jgi:membrane associated rhomboid family serine protease
MTPTQVGMRCPECAGQRTPVRTLRTVVNYPRATYALIAINVIAFFTEQGQLTVSGSSIHGTVIDEGILAREPVALGHQYWRLLTSGFLHENLMHIGFNMLILYWVGRMIEPAIGSARLLAIYFPGVTLVGNLAIGAVLLYGGFRVIDHQMQIGVLVTFLLYLQRFFEPLIDLSQFYSLFH